MPSFHRTDARRVTNLLALNATIEAAKRPSGTPWYSRPMRQHAEMETLGGLAAHSAPATQPATPALRAASPCLPAMVRGQQSWPAPHATRSSLLLAAMLALGCAGGGGTGNSAGTGGAGGMGTGGTGAGGTATNNGCASDLTGTWDIIATPTYSSPGSGTLVIGTDTLTVSINRGTTGAYRLAYSTQGGQTLRWQDPSHPAIPIDVLNTPVALNAGSIPLALGGSWSFSANLVRFSFSIGASASSLIVGRLPTGTVVGGSWPGTIPMPRLGETYSVTRTSQLVSQFGFFGGQWQATTDKNSDTCFVRVESNTVQFNCQTGNVFNGTTQLTVGSDCVASGLSNSGYELSARRR